MGGQYPSDFHTLLSNYIEKSVRHLEEKIHLKDVVLFASIQQFGRARNRTKIHRIKGSAEHLLSRIHIIDKELKRYLPIFIAGELAYIYDSFIPENT